MVLRVKILRYVGIQPFGDFDTCSKKLILQMLSFILSELCYIRNIGKEVFVLSIGKNITKYRKILNLTQEELGVKLGVTNQAVSKWESEVSMPDVMLLPQIASVLGVTLEDIYGLSKKQVAKVSADEFPAFSYQKLIELFYDNTKMRFTSISRSNEAQLGFLANKLMDGCRIGCISNTQGAIIMTKDFLFLDRNYKALGSEDIIRNLDSNEPILMYLSDKNLRKVLFYQYKTAIERSKENDTEFTFEEIMRGCNLSESETSVALRLMQNAHLNEVYMDQKIKKYIFSYSNALYALAIYKLVELLTEDPVWTVVRDTSIISDYAFYE